MMPHSTTAKDLDDSDLEAYGLFKASQEIFRCQSAPALHNATRCIIGFVGFHVVFMLRS